MFYASNHVRFVIQIRTLFNQDVSMDKFNIQLPLQFGLTVILFLSSFFVLSFIKSMVLKYGTKEKIAEKRILYIKKFFGFIVYSLAFLCFALIWGIDFRGIFIFASSFFAVVGIALFASWSVLSNITSSIILFFSFPYKFGDKIKILDGDNTISGKLQDITMFNLQIEDEEGNIITFPNNLAIQKAIIKYNQKKRDSE